MDFQIWYKGYLSFRPVVLCVCVCGQREKTYRYHSFESAVMVDIEVCFFLASFVLSAYNLYLHVSAASFFIRSSSNRVRFNDDLFPRRRYRMMIHETNHGLELMDS